MKKETRKHLQKYCDVSNWSRMHRPKTGKDNFEAGEALAEEILCLILKNNEPGYDGTAIMLTAVALVRSYIRKALSYSNAFDMNAHLPAPFTRQRIVPRLLPRNKRINPASVWPCIPQRRPTPFPPPAGSGRPVCGRWASVRRIPHCPPF